jgi:hypothetical protein
MKYTKNDHMRFLNEGNRAAIREARELMQDFAKNRRKPKQRVNPIKLGQWLQVNHRDIFNQDWADRKQKIAMQVLRECVGAEDKKVST